jgi:hypothetical protein
MTPEGIKRQVDLQHYARQVERGLWATPHARDHKDTGEHTDYERVAARCNLAGRVQQESWPTPRAADGRRTTDAGYMPERGQSLTGKLRPVNTGCGQLNPAWVTQLMGFPDGWLDIPGPPAPARRSTKGKRRALRRACPKGSQSSEA